MKKFVFVMCCCVLVSACRTSYGPTDPREKRKKVGCQSDGRNIGAERVLELEEKGKKAPKTPKFKG